MPKDVQRNVWRRDRGCCAEYGYIEGLEYGHIIPIAEGNGNTGGACNYSTRNAID
jgi:5-methylcytosine-specific restriction endonuclease McrA